MDPHSSPLPQPSTPRSTAAAHYPERVAAVTSRLDAATTAYLAHVRQAAARLAHHELDPSDARGALEELGELVTIDTDVPTLSRRPAARYLKTGVKQLSGWYLRYVAAQVTAFGTATVAFGTAMAARADALEAATAALARRVEDLEGRLAAIEVPADRPEGSPDRSHEPDHRPPAPPDRPLGQPQARGNAGGPGDAGGAGGRR
jgi:hypothetical protein